eukprot:gene642-10346_t
MGQSTNTVVGKPVKLEAIKVVPRGLKSTRDQWLYSFIKKLKMATMTSSERQCIDRLSREEIVNTTKRLCDDYIEDRLIRSGLQLKERKLGNIAQETVLEVTESDSSDSFAHTASRKRKSAVNSTSLKPAGILRSLSTSSNVAPDVQRLRRVSWQDEVRGVREKHRKVFDKRNPSDVACLLCTVGEILELRHAGVYNDLFTQLNIHMISEITLRRAFIGVAKEIFRDGISWAKVVSLFAFAGGMAVDCVLNCANMYVARLKSWTVQFIENDLCDWILLQGGWVCNLGLRFAISKLHFSPVRDTSLIPGVR